MSTEKVILSVVAGAAVGVLIGVLLAPEKGTETRRKIIKQGNDYSRDVKQKFNEFLFNVTNSFKGRTEGRNSIRESDLKKEPVIDSAL